MDCTIDNTVHCKDEGHLFCTDCVKKHAQEQIFGQGKLIGADLNLPDYSLDQVLGRNCHFLQGPETDPKAVEKIRRSIEEGLDMSIFLLNYRVDGTIF